MGVTCTAVAGLQGVGRGDAEGCRRVLSGAAPAPRLVPRDGTAVIVLQPYLPECLQGGEVPEVWRRVGGLHPRQELIAVRADLAGERLAFTGVLRQARLVGAEAVTRIPCWRYLLLHPG